MTSPDSLTNSGLSSSQERLDASVNILRTGHLRLEAVPTAGPSRAAELTNQYRRRLNPFCCGAAYSAVPGLIPEF